jgi:hypothetical protein
MNPVLIRSLFILLTLIKGTTLAQARQAPNWIDLTRPLPPLAEEAQGLFDESLTNAPNFSVFQYDPRLSDLFATTGRSELCFPSALAQSLIYFKAYHEPRFERLEIPGLSADSKKVDAAKAVRAFAKTCKTHPSEGTGLVDAMSCANSILKSAYPASHLEGIVADIPGTREPLPFTKKTLSLQEIRSALKAGEAVILNIGWYRYSNFKRGFVRASGHFVTVVGYDANESWGDDQIILKVINPAFAYDPSGKTRIFDTVILTKVKQKPGVKYPLNLGYTLIGNGFERTNLVDWLLIFKPQ